MKNIRFIRPAELELLDADQYYELQATGLGSDFLEKVESAIYEITENPELCPEIRNRVRRRLIRRFPYGLLYRIDPDEIIILATMHLHRHPDYWIDR
jgi:toxin ParE1/3/4